MVVMCSKANYEKFVCSQVCCDGGLCGVVLKAVPVV